MPWCTRCGTSLSQHELTDGYEEIADTLRSSCALPAARSRPRAEIAPGLDDDALDADLERRGGGQSRPRLRAGRATEGHVYYVSAGRGAADLQEARAEVLGTVRRAARWSAGPTTARSTTCRWQQGVEHRVIPWERGRRDRGIGHRAHRARAAAPRTTSWARSTVCRSIAPLDGYGHLPRRLRLAHRHGRARRWRSRSSSDLKEKGIFFRQETYRHRYPFCWRCKEKLVFRVEDEWFIACDEIRPRMKAAARDGALDPRVGRASACRTGTTTWETGASPASGTGACRCRSTSARTGT